MMLMLKIHYKFYLLFLSNLSKVVNLCLESVWTSPSWDNFCSRNSESKLEIETRNRNSKSKLEIETGNRNSKSKLEIETRNRNSKLKLEIDVWKFNLGHNLDCEHNLDFLRQKLDLIWIFGKSSDFWVKFRFLIKISSDVLALRAILVLM